MCNRIGSYVRHARVGWYQLTNKLGLGGLVAERRADVRRQP